MLFQIIRTYLSLSGLLCSWYKPILRPISCMTIPLRQQPAAKETEFLRPYLYPTGELQLMTRVHNEVGHSN